MKTVMHLIETGGTGGAETVYVNLVRELDTTRWRHVPVLPVREWMYDQLVDAGHQPVLISEKSALDVVFFARLLALIRSRGVDLIHAHLFGSAVRAALLSRLSGVPAIATLHGGMDLGSRQRFLNAKVGLLESGLSKIVLVSEPLRREVLSALPLPPGLTEVIPNGIDPASFRGGDGAGFREQLGIAPDEFVVGTVATPGRVAKGLDIFLETAALLKQRSPGIRFVIVGDLALGRGAALLEQRTALGLDRDVVVTGFRDDVANALAAFDVYALTSRSEGFSIALIEAMASGLPVIATRCGGPEQIVSDERTGLLVQNESVEQIAAAIERLHASPDERERLGAAARVAVEQDYSLDAQIRSYERLYAAVTATNTSDSPAAADARELTPARPAGVSVVIPAYNRAAFIRATVESILAQSHPPLEIIIVDDGSTDNTPEVCAALGSSIRYMRRQNEGPAGARNAGILAATGDWIAFCDSDDLWDREKLEIELAVLHDTNTKWCFSEFRIIDPDDKPVRADKPGFVQAFPVLQEGLTPAEHFAAWLTATRLEWQSSAFTVYHGDMLGMLFLGNVVLPTTAVVARELIDRAGPFDPEFRRAEDTEFFHRLSSYAPGAIIMRPLASYRVGHPSFMTSDPTPFIEYTLRSLDQAAARRSLTPAEKAAFREGRAGLRQRLAYTRLTAYDRAGARRAVLESWRKDRDFSPRGAAIIAAALLPGAALRGLYWAKRRARQLLG